MHSPICGRYEVLEKLGSGGMGEVYRARDLQLERFVAVKVLRADRGGERERFLREARAASALQHPHIVTVHDVVCDDGVDVMVMELVEGRTLGALIPRGGMAVGQVVGYAVQIVDALEAAHAAGIVHRDLKPGNIMVTGRDQVKLLDFGLAKWVGVEGEALTVEGAIVGTFCYMSPEQAQGRAADARSDVFSLGAVLFEMATGERAFAAEDGVLERVEAGLADVIRQCMRKAPGERFQTMGEVRAALVFDSGLLAETVIVAPRVRMASRRWWWVGVPVVLGIGWVGLRPKAAVVAPLAPPAPVIMDKPSPTAVAPPPAAPAMVTVPEGTRVRLSLRTEIGKDAQAGMALAFTVTDAVTVGGVVVVGEGAVARGVLAGLEKKKRAVVRLLTVAGLALRDGEEYLDNQGPKEKGVVVSRGTTTVAQTAGVQAVTVSGR